MLPFYFVTIFLTFFPWGFSLPWLTRKLWRKRDPLDRYLLGGTAVVFIVFTLVKTKLPHYTLPAFPLLALLLAKALLDFPKAQRFVRRTALTGACHGTARRGSRRPLSGDSSSRPISRGKRGAT